PTVLNIGCSDDPLHFGDGARHVDIDDWSKYFKFFTQADAHELPFADQSYDVVILGDIIEHALNPDVMLKEAARVCSRLLVATVFEEWKLPSGTGQHIEEAQMIADEESQKLGYLDGHDYQLKNFPEMVLADESKMPHLYHINQLSDEIVNMLFQTVAVDDGFTILEAGKAYEATFSDGHRMHNWLICMERVQA
ncbi:hypothetical protein LCGC14_2102790, partial [marine sediment metagenome]